MHRHSLVRSTTRRRALATSMLARGTACACLIGLGTTGVQAQTELPSGGVVASGSATIATAPNSVTVVQTTSRAIVNWNSFNVAAGNSVVFEQPDAGSATLNRVTGTMGSQIAGQVRANGAVYLVNPNGIAITATGTVQTGGGFIASTLAISDADFEAGRLNFTGAGASARVSNGGAINAGHGSYVALLGGSVGNSGTISVAYGRVGLGSGEGIALDINGDGFMRVAIPTSAIAGDGALIGLSGSITASGGIVELRAATVRDAVRNVINLSGGISADSATGNGGTIILHGGDGGSVSFEVVPESLEKTTMGGLRAGDLVNIERSLRVGESFGGHYVTGHVDGIGEIVKIERQGDQSLFRVSTAPGLIEQMLDKGSVSVDGVSLTIVEVARGEGWFSFATIPHTMECTILGRASEGGEVNIETDAFGKWALHGLQRLRGDEVSDERDGPPIGMFEGGGSMKSPRDDSASGSVGE